VTALLSDSCVSDTTTGVDEGTDGCANVKGACSGVSTGGGDGLIGCVVVVGVAVDNTADGRFADEGVLLLSSDCVIGSVADVSNAGGGENCENTPLGRSLPKSSNSESNCC
jgi:hypothetical protein